MGFDIHMGVPGWVRYREIENVCKYIAGSGYTDILEAGPFGGRLTRAICKSMPDVTVTALDHFNDITYREVSGKTKMTCAEEYLDEKHTPEHFRSMHDYPNLNLVVSDLFAYDRKHQLVINQMGLAGDSPFSWEDVFDHCMSLSTGSTIGVLSELGASTESKGRKTLELLYDHVIHHQGEYAIYELIRKKNA